MNITSFFRDPLLHFLVFGLLLFFVIEFFFDADDSSLDSSLIKVSQQRQNQLFVQFSNTWQRQPTPSEKTGLIDTYILEEIYYREALKLGLDKNDALIRRRLKQKLQYLQEDLSSYQPPEKAELAAWYEKNKERFTSPRRYTFQQILLKPEDPSNVEAILFSLNAGDTMPSTHNASGLLETNNTALSSQMITNRFGELFASELSTMKTQAKWQGPIQSTFGTHLVLLETVIEPETPDLSRIKDKVMQQYIAERREEANVALQNQLKNNYRIEIE